MKVDPPSYERLKIEVNKTLLHMCYISGNTYPCFFPCSRQNRTFTSLTDGLTSNFSTGDPSVFISTTNNTAISFECYERSGPFIVLRRRLHDGRYVYRCLKDTSFETTYDVAVWYETRWICFPEPPSICDVCNGTGFGDVRVFKAMGCNLPRQCPVTVPHIQHRCTGCEASESSDDGLCCTELGSSSVDNGGGSR
ncbi:Hypothetical predicted protein [Mytilus galloprovincialis]|uniref:Uncharacterized protein n=1 Tax=Mytilus galloprovincialis TaxID=29158 RepID=A0A8B6HQ03_MYTGA|nr:Hypothetical predicted protein [Mytilus galloprovincialis]